MPPVEQAANVTVVEARPYVSYLDKLREDPEKLAAHLERIGLPRSLASGTNEEIRGAVIESMIRNRAPALDLGGLTIRQFAHADHDSDYTEQ